jgi:hypothetical protein
MAGVEDLDVARFAALYEELAEAVSRAAPEKDPVFGRLLAEHLGRDTTELPIIATKIDQFDHANLQRALDALFLKEDIEVDRIVGVRGEHRMFGNLTLSVLTQKTMRLEIGPVDHVELPIDASNTLTCIDFGLVLLHAGSDALALLVRSGDQMRGGTDIHVEVIGPTREAGAELLGRVRSLMIEHNVFRGNVISLEPTGRFDGSITARFIARPGLARDDVILPDGVLERIERMTVDFSERAASLRAGGRHLRRGILLHGQPGTGKTHTVRYLLSRLEDRTVFILAGAGLGVVGHTVRLARLLQPAIVVLEDVDLVAEERTRPHAGTNPVLFDLLNHMDGVEEDADIVFLLTTNRPDLLEPALASRPGRVDLAVEVPLPAASERRRLLELYSDGLATGTVEWDPIVDRTDGVSAAFLRELLRQAALAGAADDDAVPTLDQDALVGVLADLAHASQAMTVRLLGSPG